MLTQQPTQNNPLRTISPPVKRMLFGLMVQSAIDLMDQGMFNVAMPSIQLQYDLQIEVLSIVVAVRILARVGLMPVYGFIGDRFGRQRTFTIGLSIFILGSIISFLAPSVLWIVMGRVLQGVGGGILPLAMAIISDQFSSERRGQMLGLWNSSAPLGVILGPPIGGFLIEGYGWKSIFILSLIGSLCALLLIIKVVPTPTVNHPPNTSTDWLGAVGIFTFTSSLLMATTTTGIFPLGSHMNMIFWGLFLLATVFLIWNTITNADSLISLSILKNRQLIFPSIAVTFRMFCISGTIFLMVLYLANVLGKTTSAVGLFLIAHSLPIFLFIPIGGLMADKWKPGNVAVLGMFIQAIGMLWLSLINPMTNELLLIPGMFIGGLGAGLSLTPFTKGAVASLGEKQVGVASGLFNMIRFAGAAVSAPLLGLVLAASFEQYGGSAAVPEPYQYAFLILTGCALIGMGLASIIPIDAEDGKVDTTSNESGDAFQNPES
jgi:MFS family permease